MARQMIPMDGNEAVARVAHATNEVIAIYPITPSSPMGEWSDAFSAAGKKNIWGTIPLVSELQSEGGASGSVHGALQAGAMTTTFTASQGLLLMIPNMHKVAGELTSTVFHVSARSLANHALSIFGDHADVMDCRATGFAMLASNSVQEAHDMAMIAQMSTLKSRVPFLHFFDGFRTSHEVQKIEVMDEEDIRALIDDEDVLAHRARGLNPDRPFIRGTAQNPDVYFQSLEASNPFYDKTPGIVEDAMNAFAKQVGRQYKLFDYFGAEDAENIIILMGSGAETAKEAVIHWAESGEKWGLLQVRLYRPWSTKHFIEALPKTARRFAVLDRTKEPGSLGEPLYTDVRTAFGEAMQDDSSLFGGNWPIVVGGRYGLSSKEFTPAMVKGVFDNLNAETPKNHFTVGINDDVTNTSIDYDHQVDIEPDSVTRCMFYGLGSDGTVGANKNSIKIIADNTDNYAQGYFVYDSKKAGSLTVSHLRFGSNPIMSTYLVRQANFIACHQWPFLEKYDMLKNAVKGATFLLNSPYSKDEVWEHLPKEVQEDIINKELKFYVIDAGTVAQKTGMGVRINTVMQTCFFYISGVLEKDKAIELIKAAAKKAYGKKGDEVVQKNWDAIDGSVAELFEVDYSGKSVTGTVRPPILGSTPDDAFIKDVTSEIMAQRGDDIPVSKLPVDGTFPSATTQYEKRNIARDIPVWEEDLCIQCGKCSLVCPHAAIRMKIYDADTAAKAPAGFKTADAKTKQYEGMKATVQCFAEDCTGCGQCVNVCPAKSKEDPAKKAINMVFKTEEMRQVEKKNVEFFLDIPEISLEKINMGTVKGSQLRKPLFEFSGCCAGCGETPYYKLATQLFGDRMIVANATGCSSIYGGNLPTTPFTVDAEGRGPAWSNSLFEDNAEFGFGFALTRDKFKEYAGELLKECSLFGDEIKDAILGAEQVTQIDIEAQRARIAEVKAKLEGNADAKAKQLYTLADYLVKKSVWIVGGDGWAYDIGYGGLDHVLASGKNVNVLVMDTGVYSNTGGQMSKATPTGAVAKFAANGRELPKKDLGMIAMTYGNIYVASCAMGANDNQVVKAFLEAESYDGPSLLICYSHCIAQGIPMNPPHCNGLAQQKLAVDSGFWPLYRFDPRNIAAGKNPLMLDGKPSTISYKDFALTENRFRSLNKINPDHSNALLDFGQTQVTLREKLYQKLAELDMN